jgi:RNA polymerase-interacting CarD/CdnL/TRCF family regulator
MVWVIERIETKTIMGTTCGFYQLRMANETTVFVPVDNVDGVGSAPRDHRR